MPAAPGPLGEAASAAGPGLHDGVRAGLYTCFQVSWPAEGVLEVVLNRPQALNAMSVDFVRELHQILDVLQYPLSAAAAGAAGVAGAGGGAAAPCRVLILRGEGSGFCAGFDLKDKRFGKADGPMLQHAFSSLIRKLRDIPQPVVCGVNGVAAGGGLSLALAGDVRIGLPDSRFICSFVRLGLGGGELGTSYFLPRIIGRGRASQLLLTGAELDGETAERWGLLSRVVPTVEDLGPACLEVARQMLSLSPKGLRYTKWLLNGSQEMPLQTALEREDLAQNYMSADRESQEVGARHRARFAKSAKSVKRPPAAKL